MKLSAAIFLVALTASSSSARRDVLKELDLNRDGLLDEQELRLGGGEDYEVARISHRPRYHIEESSLFDRKLGGDLEKWRRRRVQVARGLFFFVSCLRGVVVFFRSFT